MKRFLSILLALALALTLGIPALAAEHQAGDTYIRILGSSGARTVGVRTTYGAYRQTADGAVYRDDQYEFVYTDDGVSWVCAGAAESSLGSGMYDGTQFLAGPFGSERPAWRSADGVHWTALTPEEQDTAPAIQRGRSPLNGLTFTLRGGRELWVTDGQGRAVELTADFSSFLASYDMADVQAYPVPQGIRVEVYSRYGYETGASHTYPAAELKQRLAAAQPVAFQPELLRVAGNGKLLLGQARSGTDGMENLYTTDGLTWKTAEGMPAGRLLPYNGKSFVVVSGEPAGVYASEDGLTWKSLEGTPFQPEREAVLADYTFLWTGTEYISCRTVEEPYGPHGARGDWTSAWNTRVCFADENFQLIGSHDFGANVTGVGWADGVYYAQAGGTVYSSADRTHWTATTLTSIPAAPAAAPYTLRVTGTQVEAAPAGSSQFVPLFTAPSEGLRAILRRGESVYAVELVDAGGRTEDVQVFTAAQMAAKFPKELRVTVDGKPVTFTISLYQVSGCTMAPLRQMAQALGYTFDYDGASRTAVCTRGTDTISVRAASTQATVNGKTTNWLAVPAELRGGIFCVPVRFFAEAAGADVTWDAAGQTFYLTTAIQEG